MSAETNAFVKTWVRENVRNIVGMDDPRPEIARLSFQMIADALNKGISEADLTDTVGDIGSYVTEKYEGVRDPDAGFRKRA